MLVLSRRVGESIVMNGNIVVRIVDVRGSNVRLGFDAPPEVRIDRQEVHDKIKRGDPHPNAEQPGHAASS